VKPFTLLLIWAWTFAALAQQSPLSAPVGKEKLTFQQIENQKIALKDKIVLVEILRLLGDGSDFGSGIVRYLAKDTSGSERPYGQILFPREVLNKPGFLNNKDPFSVYVRVHYLGGKAAALCEAVGTHFSIDPQGNATYEW
jgi:hypothetical protein